MSGDAAGRQQTPAEQLLALEALLDTADVQDGQRLAEIEQRVSWLLQVMVQRRSTRYLRAPSQQLDARRTVWQAARQDGLVTELVFRERPREHRLVLLLDGSESFRPFVLWAAVVALALRRAVADLPIWVFDRDLSPLPPTVESLAGMVAQLKRGQARGGRSMLDLPAMVEQIARLSGSTAQSTLLVISDLLIPPGPTDTALGPTAAARRALRRFRAIRVLDPTTLYQPYENSDGDVSVPGSALAAEPWRTLLAGGLHERRVAESDRSYTIDAASLERWQRRLATQPVFTARRATAYLRALGVPLIQRTGQRSVLAELLFEGGV